MTSATSSAPASQPGRGELPHRLGGLADSCGSFMWVFVWAIECGEPAGCSRWWSQARSQEFAMNPIHRSRLVRRVAGVLAGLAALLTSLTTGGSASASQLRADPPWSVTHPKLPVDLPPLPAAYFKHPPLPDPARVHATLAVGISGWQITLIAVGGAVLAAATVAVLW